MIIAIVVGLIIGACMVFFIKSKPKDNSVTTTDNQEVSFLKSSIYTLENEKQKLLKKLADNESLLKTIQSSGDTSSNSNDLLKEINKLKDEIEDMEDSIDDLEAKNKKIRSEKNEIEENLNNIEKENRELLTTKEDLSIKLATKVREAEKDNKSLTFVNSILNANNASDKDMEELDRKTWEIYSFISNSVYDCLKNHTDEAENLGYYAWDWRNTEKKTWIKNKKVVAIVGEFSAGKTSIVNRILSQDDPDALLLPTSSKETTAIPTYISKSKDFNCQFYSPDGDLRTIKKETFEMVTKSVLDKVNVSHLIKYFVLSYNNKHLDNISILDTPGFGSNSDEIIKRTTDVVKEAHALFWVIDINAGDLNQTSIKVMKDHLNGVPLYFIINKTDGKSPDDIEKMKEHIKKTAFDNDIQFKDIISFHKDEKVEVLMKYINEIQIEEQPPLMRYILDELNSWIKKKEKEKNDLRKERKEIDDTIDIRDDNFNFIKNEISSSADTIERLVKINF
ncbi:dynamin family protein [Flavobacterium sp. xlx-214]|nr:dynamin family protein [Flavobacterium sp. xlx-214]MBA5792338.1 dynamin family protein [Flavobacterium sp. xlx-221]QMI82347.1 dynamin family protein [Flavobacterium sp. xlx-214]